MIKTKVATMIVFSEEEDDGISEDTNVMILTVGVFWNPQ